MPGRRVLMVLIVLSLAGAILLSGCAAVDFDQLSYEAGRQARRAFDVAMDQLGQFVAGFCSGGAAPAALATVAVIALRKRW